MSLARPIAFLRNALRQSPWVVISISAHVVLVAVFSIVYMTRHTEPTHTYVVDTIPMKEREALPHLPEPEPPMPRFAIPPDATGEVVPDEFAFSFADPVLEPVDLTKDVGDPQSSSLDFLPKSVSSSIGPGGSGGRGGGPSAFPGRPGDKLTGGSPGGRPPLGPSEGTNRAVLEGLRWLVRHQRADGSWGADSFRECCDAGHSCAAGADALTDRTDEGLTGLALLAFLGAGFSNTSRLQMVDPVRGKAHVVGDVVKRGLQWLMKRQRADGSFSVGNPFLYNEALGTMALAEAFGLTGNRTWGTPAQRGVDFLVAAQKLDPHGEGLWGWRYTPRSMDAHDADSSVTGWVVMALKSAELSALEVPRATLDGALAFTRAATASDGLVGYLSADGAGLPITGEHDEFTYHVATMSALGACTRAFLEHDPEDPFFDLAARQIVKDLPAAGGNRLGIDYYYWYYATLALNQLDGPDSPRRSGRFWDKWNRALTESLLGLQAGDEKRCARGGWLVPDRWSATGGPIYSTAINVLTLEVYYRYANAFSGGKRRRR